MTLMTPCRRPAPFDIKRISQKSGPPFRSLIQIMKARPGALEHELVLCTFDCFNKSISFEQVNLEISLMATL